MKAISLILLLLLPITARGEMENVEQSVCAFYEPAVFWLWKQAAGRANPERALEVAGAEAVSHTTADGRVLSGYRVAARGVQESKGYVLAFLGNAMLSDGLVGPLDFLADAGYDLFVYDYRGYGRSGGRTRLKAIIHDAVELIADLNAKGYRRRLLFGMSLGGIVVLNAIGAGAEYDRAVIDSAPSRISGYGCPKRYDPVENVPRDASRLMLVFGDQDRTVTPKTQSELLSKARKRGAVVYSELAFAHPFQDIIPTVHQRRMSVVAEFLTNTGGEASPGQ